MITEIKFGDKMLTIDKITYQKNEIKINCYSEISYRHNNNVYVINVRGSGYSFSEAYRSMLDEIANILNDKFSVDKTRYSL